VKELFAHANSVYNVDVQSLDVDKTKDHVNALIDMILAETEKRLDKCRIGA
jgi:hypothetical protein